MERQNSRGEALSGPVIASVIGGMPFASRPPPKDPVRQFWRATGTAMPGVRALYKTREGKAPGTFSRACSDPPGASAARRQTVSFRGTPAVRSRFYSVSMIKMTDPVLSRRSLVAGFAVVSAGAGFDAGVVGEGRPAPLARAFADYERIREIFETARRRAAVAFDATEGARLSWIAAEERVRTLRAGTAGGDEREVAIAGARRAAERARGRLHDARRDVGFDALDAACIRACEELTAVVERIAGMRPATIEDFLRKLEILALTYAGRGTGLVDFVDFFDLARADLTALSGRPYHPGAATMALHRCWSVDGGWQGPA